MFRFLAPLLCSITCHKPTHCHMSHVTCPLRCHMSHVTCPLRCHMSHVTWSITLSHVHYMSQANTRVHQANTQWSPPTLHVCPSRDYQKSRCLHSGEKGSGCSKHPRMEKRDSRHACPNKIIQEACRGTHDAPTPGRPHCRRGNQDQDQDGVLTLPYVSETITHQVQKALKRSGLNIWITQRTHWTVDIPHSSHLTCCNVTSIQNHLTPNNIT